jgi:hypothetical protein
LEELEIPEALTFSLYCTIKDSYECSHGRADTARKLMGFDSKRGFYKKDIVREIRNRAQQVIGGEVIGKKTQYIIPFTAERAREILTKYPKDPNFSMTIRKEGETQRSYSVRSEDIFCDEKNGLDIISTNIATIPPNEKGGKDAAYNKGDSQAIEYYRRWQEKVTEAERQGKRVITIDSKADSLIKETGMTVEELAKEHLARQRDGKQKTNRSKK